MLCIVPARAGSKGVIGKNARLLGERSLLEWAVYHGQQARGVSRVVVSTDDEALARIAQEAGAEVPFLRPAVLATDTARAREVYLHVVDTLGTTDAPIESFVVLQPTSPLRTPQDVDGTLDAFVHARADVALSVVPPRHPVEWTLVEREANLRPLMGLGGAAHLRQDAEEVYLPNGAVFVFRSDYLRSHETYYEGRTVKYVMPPERSVDIDTEFDLKMAEFLLRVTP